MLQTFLEQFALVSLNLDQKSAHYPLPSGIRPNPLIYLCSDFYLFLVHDSNKSDKYEYYRKEICEQILKATLQVTLCLETSRAMSRSMEVMPAASNTTWRGASNQIYHQPPKQSKGKKYHPQFGQTGVLVQKSAENALKNGY